MATKVETPDHLLRVLKPFVLKQQPADLVHSQVSISSRMHEYQVQSESDGLQICTEELTLSDEPAQ